VKTNGTQSVHETAQNGTAAEDWRVVVAEIVREHEGIEGAVLPVLHAVQHRLGHISEEALEAIAEGLHLTTSQLYAVATFYNEFRLGPQPAHQVTVCRGPACRAAGGRQVRRRLEELLGVEVGEEAVDHHASIDTAGCHGVCPHAPAIVVDGALIGRVTVADVESMVAGTHPRANLSSLAANGSGKVEVGR
jgi:formate dehydrogenase subunit gamma